MPKKLYETEPFTRDELDDLYTKQEMSTKAIATKYGYKSSETIKRALRKHNIQARQAGQSQRERSVLRSRLSKGVGDLNGSKWCAIRHSALARGLELTITQEYAWGLFQKQGGRCALSGVEITLCPHRALQLADSGNETASLDRIDSTKGYVPGNVQWIHKDLQRMKWQFPEDQFFRWCATITQYRGSKPS
jgi:hypothetical protein